MLVLFVQRGVDTGDAMAAVTWFCAKEKDDDAPERGIGFFMKVERGQLAVGPMILDFFSQQYGVATQFYLNQQKFDDSRGYYTKSTTRFLSLYLNLRAPFAEPNKQPCSIERH